MPSRLAYSPQNRILLQPALSLPVPFIKSLKLTSSVSAPHVCESIVQRGILSQRSLVRLNSPPSLLCRRRIRWIKSEKSQEGRFSVNDCRRVGMCTRLFVELKMEVELKLVLLSTEQKGCLATRRGQASLQLAKSANYSISRRNARSTEMHAFSLTKPPTLKAHKMSHEERMKKARRWLNQKALRPLITVKQLKSTNLCGLRCPDESTSQKSTNVLPTRRSKF